MLPLHASLSGLHAGCRRWIGLRFPHTTLSGKCIGRFLSWFLGWMCWSEAAERSTRTAKITAGGPLRSGIDCCVIGRGCTEVGPQLGGRGPTELSHLTLVLSRTS